MLNSGFVPSMQVWPADKTPAFLIVVLIQNTWQFHVRLKQTRHAEGVAATSTAE